MPGMTGLGDVVNIVKKVYSVDIRVAVYIVDTDYMDTAHIGEIAHIGANADTSNHRNCRNCRS